MTGWDETQLEDARTLAYYVARSYGRSPDDAEDLAQDAILKILYRLSAGEQIGEDSSARAYTAVVAANTHREMVRRDVRRQQREFRVAHGDRFVSTSRTRPGVRRSFPVLRDIGEEVVVEHTFATLLDRLPHTQRRVARLVYLDGFNAREAAERLGVSRQAVNKSLRRAKYHLQELFHEMSDVDTDTTEGSRPKGHLRGSNLDQADLHRVDLVDTDLVGATLVSANLIAGRLARACLRDADLSGASLRNADLTGADLSGARLTDADLTGVNLSSVDLSRADLTRTNLSGSNLTGVELAGLDLTKADLTSANLTRANLTDADGTEVILARAILSEANLTRANLTNATLSGSNLAHADLSDADLHRADITGALLIGTQFRGANLIGADLLWSYPSDTLADLQVLNT